MSDAVRNERRAASVSDSRYFSPPGGLLNYTTETNLSVTTAASIVAPAPTNAMTGSNRDCAEWYTVSPSAQTSEAEGIITDAASRSPMAIRAVWYPKRTRYPSPTSCSSIQRSTRIVQTWISASLIALKLLELSRPIPAMLLVVVRQ